MHSLVMGREKHANNFVQRNLTSLLFACLAGAVTALTHATPARDRASKNSPIAISSRKFADSTPPPRNLGTRPSVSVSFPPTSFSNSIHDHVPWTEEADLPGLHWRPEQRRETVRRPAFLPKISPAIRRAPQNRLWLHCES